MTLTVVAKNLNQRNGTVTVQGDSQEEVMSPTAKNLAIEAAGEKIARAGVSGNEVAYPVDANVEYSEDLVMGRAGEVSAYRCDYNLTGGL